MKATLLGVVIASAAWADKPVIAVTGVTPNDASLAKAAASLDEGLRAGLAATYRVSRSTRQVAAAVRRAACDVRTTPCAVTVGEALRSNFVLAGEIDRRGGRGVLVLYLVDVAKGKRTRKLREVVPLAGNLRKHAVRAVAKLADAERAQLVIRANAPSGEILVDGEVRGALFEGRASVALPAGSYDIEVRAPGFQRHAETVTVEGTHTMSILLMR